MEAQVYERMAELDSSHWWFVARREILEEVIRRIVRPPENARILEIGCGTGHNLPMLSKFGPVEASELDDKARALASARFGRRIEAAALPDLSVFPEAHFDLVALLDVLEHVPDDRSALAAIRTRLKPGGKLLVTVPANPWMWSAHDVAHHHHRRYRKAELGKAARAAARIAGRLTGRESADDAMPPRPLNSVLRGIFALESALVGRVPLPVGVSLVAVLRRPA